MERETLDTILAEHQTWRETAGRSGRQADLSGADLAGMDLGGVNLPGADLRRARLEGTNLRAAHLAGADLSFTRAEKADLSGADLAGVNFDHAGLERANLQDSRAPQARFATAHLWGADLQRADAVEADFTGAKLNGADLTDAHLQNSKFCGADLTEAQLNRADLEGADLERAWLISTQMEGTNLRHTILEREPTPEVDSPTQQPTVWKTVKAAAADWFTRAKGYPGKDHDYPDYHANPDTRKADVEAEPARRIDAETREATAAWIAGHPEEAREAVDKARDQTVSQPQEREERRLDMPVPGPTEAAGGSFRVLPSKADAEQYAQRLPPSQESRIDRIIDQDGPTDSYAVPTLPPAAEVARDKRVAEQVERIEDPAQRAEAQRLLRIIREEPPGREQPRREQEAELER